MYTLSFTLKQHTPIIHFQHDQEGATLRATEVKPKFDRFIIKINGGIDKCRKEHPDWFLSAKHNSINYKISILPVGDSKAFAISSNPSSNQRDPDRIQALRENISAEYLSQTQYFADNQYIDKPRQHNLIRKGIIHTRLKLTIYSLNTSLLLLLKSVFASFIVSENFGTRQSKGFGCFSIEGMTDDQIVNHLKTNKEITGIFKKANTRPFRDKLQFLSDHYGKLKRGSSFGGYQKSKLWDYLCSKNAIKWEKRKIKLHILANDKTLFDRLKYDSAKYPKHNIDDCGTGGDNGTFYYIRALLGLAEHYEFMLVNPNGRLKVGINDKLNNSKKTEKYAVDRFRSPIRYYVTDENIYLITQEINPLLQTYTDEKNISHPREFEFTIENMKISISLQIPQSFNLPEFITRYGSFGNNLK